jgi:hypothetical protein
MAFDAYSDLILINYIGRSSPTYVSCKLGPNTHHKMIAKALLVR